MMSETSDYAIAVFARAYDAVLFEGKAKPDLTREIMASLQGVRHPRDLAAVLLDSHLSGGEVWGRPHLTRLRAKYLSKETEK